MDIKANIKFYLILMCVLAIAIPLVASGFSLDWMLWGLVLPVLMLGLIWETLRPPSIIGARVDDDIVEFRVLSWIGVHTSAKYPIQEVKCIRVLHSFTGGGSRCFRYEFHLKGKKIGTLYAFTLYWTEASLERFIGLFGPDVFKA